MASLLDLELSRDDLVEQIMNFIQEGEVEGITDTVALLDSFDRLEAQIATKVDAIAAVVAAKEGEIAYLKKRRLFKYLVWIYQFYRTTNYFN